MNIWLVDDEKEIADVIELYLQNDQYQILKFYTVAGKLTALTARRLILHLDIIYRMWMVSDFKTDPGEYISGDYVLTAKTEYMDKITGSYWGRQMIIFRSCSQSAELAVRVTQLRR